MTDSHLHHHESFTPSAQQESPTLKHILLQACPYSGTRRLDSSLPLESPASLPFPLFLEGRPSASGTPSYSVTKQLSTFLSQEST